MKDFSLISEVLGIGPGTWQVKGAVAVILRPNGVLEAAAA